MRKKTIKSYFFKQAYNEPAISYLAAFSKRAIRSKIRAKIAKLSSRLKRSYRSETAMSQYLNYRNKLYTKYYYNQWTQINQKIITKFFTSFYVTNANLRWQTLRLWYIFTRRLKLKNYNFMLKYNDTGIISSHYVHFLLRKNLTYQNRSKYRSKSIDLYWHNAYARLCLTLLESFTFTKNREFYQFSSDLSKRYIYLTEDLTRATDGWTSPLSANLTQKKYFYINKLGLNLNMNTNYSTLFGLSTNRISLEKIYFERDGTKRDQLIQTFYETQKTALLPHIHMVTLLKTDNVVISNSLLNQNNYLLIWVFLHHSGILS